MTSLMKEFLLNPIEFVRVEVNSWVWMITKFESWAHIIFYDLRGRNDENLMDIVVDEVKACNTSIELSDNTKQTDKCGTVQWLRKTQMSDPRP